jgi:glycerol-3-phosphate dehydrogenase (NAD(P)+)
MASQPTSVAVLGAGSWGTALALLLARNNVSVNLWAHSSLHVTEMKVAGENSRYLPGHSFPKNLKVTADLQDCLRGIQDVLLVVPSHAFRDTLEQAKRHLPENACIAWGTKGLDPCSQKLFHEVVVEVLGRPVSMAVLSGPTLAKEVAAGLPAASSLACNNEDFAQRLCSQFHSDNFRVYQNQDLTGVELCGTVKNVLAIATGICDGMSLGANARSALITRGLAEMRRLCLEMGGLAETLMSLAGVGDLFLTCTDNGSRNRRFGLMLGEGLSIDEAKQEVGQAIEGLYNAELLFKLAKKSGVDMPIATQVYQILYQGLSPKNALQTLLAREQKTE